MDAAGKLCFVDHHHQRIYAWTEKEGLTVKRDNPLDPVNLALDKSGNLMVVSSAGRKTPCTLTGREPPRKNCRGGHIRTVPVPKWVKETLDAWLTAAGIESGPPFRCVCRAGKPSGNGISEKTVWHVVKKIAVSMNIPRLAPHDLRRQCARLCHVSGGEHEQISFSSGV